MVSVVEVRFGIVNRLHLAEHLRTPSTRDYGITSNTVPPLCTPPLPVVP